MNKEKPASNPHAGHRGRLREKYIKGGLEILSFHEILELLLFYSLPRKDTNKIAHALEEKFGKSVANIFEASDKRLKEVGGVSEQTVLFFRLLHDITRIYNIEAAAKTYGLCSKESHENLLIEHFKGRQREEVVLVTLNNRMERICGKPYVIYAGSVNSTKVDMQKMVRAALDDNASCVIVAHNHPNGRDYPTPEDLSTTRRLDRIFGELGIYFIEHYVVSDTKISGIKEQSVYGYK